MKDHPGSLSLRALCKAPHLLPGWLGLRRQGAVCARHGPPPVLAQRGHWWCRQRWPPCLQRVPGHQEWPGADAPAPGSCAAGTLRMRSRCEAGRYCALCSPGLATQIELTRTWSQPRRQASAGPVGHCPGVTVEHAHASHDVKQTRSPRPACCYCRHNGCVGRPQPWPCASFCRQHACWCSPGVPKGGWSCRAVLLAPSCTAAPVCCCSTCAGAATSRDRDRSQPGLCLYGKR